ncbi:MAG TPA: hypothetical protein VLI54_03295 [Bacillota bacterium]|nr:hypothetical protein [Bacillota bacterium]
MREQGILPRFGHRRVALTGAALLLISLGFDKCGTATPAPAPATDGGTCGVSLLRVGQEGFTAKQLAVYTGDGRNHLVDSQKQHLKGDVAADAITSIVVARRTHLSEESVTVDTMGALGAAVREDLPAEHASVTIGDPIDDGPGGDVIVRTFAPHDTCAALGRLMSIPL